LAEQNSSAPPKVSAPVAPKADTGTLATRRENFSIAIAQAILTRQAMRNPVALAREVVDYADALIAALDNKL